MKKHTCPHPSCTKAFTRAEHLRRHSLNHETGNGNNGYTCQRCHTHFSRPDLLSRHMTRHEKKDAEAGGEGKGVLETRKRMRRAEDGSIVVRPPKRAVRSKHAQLQFPGPSSSTGSGSGSGSASVSIRSISDHPGAPVSPPGSAGDDGPLSIEDEDIDSDPLLAPMMPGGPFEPYVEPIPGQFDAADGSWFADGGFEGGSIMDTATDFNLPFAATGNYNWLFDVASLDDAFHHLELPLGPDLVPFTGPIEPDPMLNLDLDLDLNGLPTFDQEDGSSVLLQAASFVERNPRTGRDMEYDWMSGPTTIESVPLQPQINDDARRGILTLIAQSPPVDIHGQPLNLDSHLLSLSALQNYSNLFFSRFNTVYPLIHTATFDPNTIEPVFLAAILSMGATYSSREAHQLAVGIHDALRNQLFCNEAFSPMPELWVLQAMLLIDCFGKMRAGPKQRERAQLFHCVLIKLIRRSTCCSIRSPTASILNMSGAELDQAWKDAMDAEQKKRLAFQCFMWDTQHSVLFSQSLCMSAFEIRSCLPCSSSAWEAHSAEEWARHANRETEHAFLPVLKGYITPNAISRPRDLNGLSRMVVLHGLMSISADLKRRDQTTLRSETPERVGAWTPRLGRAYDLWKADFDADCLTMKLSPSPIEEARRFTGLKSAALALYRAASLALHVEVLDLQIAAGAGQILGRVVSDRDRVRSQGGLSGWVSGTGCVPAARHAASLLQDAVLSLHDWDQTDAFHFPWCLYLATLVVWAFHARDESESHQDIGRLDGRLRAKPTDLSSLIVAMTTSSSEELEGLAGGYDTRPLVRAMAQQLGVVRWAVVHDAMKVLVNLGV